MFVSIAGKSMFVSIDAALTKLAEEYGWGEERKDNCRKLLEDVALYETEPDAFNAPLEIYPYFKLREQGKCLLRRQTKNAVWFLAMTMDELHELPARVENELGNIARSQSAECSPICPA